MVAPRPKIAGRRIKPPILLLAVVDERTTWWPSWGPSPFVKVSPDEDPGTCYLCGRPAGWRAVVIQTAGDVAGEAHVVGVDCLRKSLPIYGPRVDELIVQYRKRRTAERLRQVAAAPLAELAASRGPELAAKPHPRINEHWARRLTLADYVAYWLGKRDATPAELEHADQVVRVALGMESRARAAGRLQERAVLAAGRELADRLANVCQGAQGHAAPLLVAIADDLRQALAEQPPIVRELPEVRQALTLSRAL